MPMVVFSKKYLSWLLSKLTKGGFVGFVSTSSEGISDFSAFTRDKYLLIKQPSDSACIQSVAVLPARTEELSMMQASQNLPERSKPF